MKIGIAQISSQKGDCATNIAMHLQWIHSAISLDADMIVFPELSLTNYEPEIAEGLARSPDDPIFTIFQEIADAHEIVIGLGMPILVNKGVVIGMLLLQPNTPIIVHTKSILHEDEFPYFVCGDQQPILSIKGREVAFGICYESLQRDHFIQAKKQNADLYITSVCKAKGGIEKANTYFPAIAKEFQTPILMANAVGACDTFEAYGHSAVWNSDGEQLVQLDAESQRLILYDTDQEAIVLDCNG